MHPLLLATVLTGQVLYPGTAPKPKVLEIAKDTKHCGNSVTDWSLVVGKDGGIANAVVFIEHAAVESTDLPEVSIDQVGCRFVPHVVALQRGSKLFTTNSDPILHNVHGRRILENGKRKTEFNIATPIKGMKFPLRVKRPGVYRAQCDAGHDWMLAWVHVFDHGFFAVTDEHGRFRIEGLPPGKHKVTVWHEKLGERQYDVEVKADVEATLRVELKEETKKEP